MQGQRLLFQVHLIVGFPKFRGTTLRMAEHVWSFCRKCSIVPCKIVENHDTCFARFFVVVSTTPLAKRSVSVYPRSCFSLIWDQIRCRRIKLNRQLLTYSCPRPGLWIACAKKWATSGLIDGKCSQLLPFGPAPFSRIVKTAVVNVVAGFASSPDGPKFR